MIDNTKFFPKIFFLMAIGLIITFLGGYLTFSLKEILGLGISIPIMFLDIFVTYYLFRKRKYLKPKTAKILYFIYCYLNE